MKVTRGIENLVAIKNTIATLGSYDGLHLGHQDILRRLVAKQKAEGHSRAVVVTFDPHPQEVLRRNNTTVGLLTTIDERLELFEESGVDEIVIIEFNLAFSQTPYATFFKSVLIDGLSVNAMVVGYNHAFGKNREGDIEHLRALSSEYGVSVTEVPPFVVDGVQISSTKVRHALLEGDIRTANRYLDRPYQLRGRVVSGDHLGRTLGFPTANLELPKNKLIPKDGVYAAKTIHDGNEYVVAASIGSRPTVGDGLDRVVEALLLDFTADLYGQQIEISLLDFIREQKKFDSLEALKDQMALDVTKVREIVSLQRRRDS